MATKQAPYEAKKTLKSAGKAGGITLASILSVLGLARVFGIQLWDEGQDAEMATYILGAVTVGSAIWGGVKNLWSNWGRPSVATTRLPLWLLVPIAAVALQGCVTTVPAFGGKTRAETSFEDGVSPEGVQYTKYTRNVELPAGVELNGQDDMSYGWQADGSGNITIGQSGSANTVAQGELLQSRVQAEAQMATALVSLTQVIAELAAPLIGQNLDLDAAQKQTDSANDFAIRQQLTGQLENLFGQLKATQDADRATLRELLQQMQLMRGDLDAVMNAQTEP